VLGVPNRAHLPRPQNLYFYFAGLVPGARLTGKTRDPLVDLLSSNLAALDRNHFMTSPNVKANSVLTPAKLNAIPIVPGVEGWILILREFLNPLKAYPLEGMKSPLHLGFPLQLVRKVLPLTPSTASIDPATRFHPHGRPLEEL